MGTYSADLKMHAARKAALFAAVEALIRGVAFRGRRVPGSGVPGTDLDILIVSFSSTQNYSERSVASSAKRVASPALSMRCSAMAIMAS